MRKVTYDNMYNGHPLSTSSKNNQGSYIEILDGIESVLEYMLRRHGRVYFTLFVLKYPAGSSLTYRDNNALLVRFMETLTLYCRRRNYDPKYVWVREVSDTGQTHYHLMLVLNADYIHNAHGLLKKATQIWQRGLNIENGEGLVHLCEPEANALNAYGGGVKLKRNDEKFQQVFDQCYQRASYLAKRYSKGGAPGYVNEFRCSWLPY